MSPEARASLRELTLDCIRDVQIATPYSRQRYTWAAEAWAALDEDGQRQALAARADAIERCYEANYGLVIATADDWRGVENSRIGHDDIIAQCTEAFVRAMSRFDVSRGIEFSTFCMTAMSRAVVKLVDDMQPFGQSSTITRAQQRVKAAQASLLQRHGEPATIAELARATTLEERMVKLVLRIPQVISGDGTDDEDEETPLEHIPAEDQVDGAEADALRAVDGNPVIESVRDVVDTPLFAAVARQAYEAIK